MPSESATIAPTPEPELALRSLHGVQSGPADREHLSQINQVRSEAFGQPADSWPDATATRDEDLCRFRVVVDEGRVVSCLNILPRLIQIGGADLAMGGICNVATLPGARNKGYASALMRDALQAMRAQGLSTSILFPFSFRYYRKFGYELAGTHSHFWCRPHNIPQYREFENCRPAVRSDAVAINAIYTASCLRRSCGMVRSPARWQEILAGPRCQVVVHAAHGDPEGYVITRDDVDQYGGRLLVVEEMASFTAEARRGLLGHIARQPGEAVEWWTSPTDLWESGLLRSPAPLREGFKPRGIATVRPMFQFRVLDLPAALKARARSYTGLDAELTVIVRDDLLPDNQRPVAISAQQATVQIHADERSHHWLEADIRTFSQIFCGYVSAGEAWSQNQVTVSGPEALQAADLFFPRLEPFIPQMDRF